MKVKFCLFIVLSSVLSVMSAPQDDRPQVVRTPVVRTPIVRTLVDRTPVVRTPVARTPVVRKRPQVDRAPAPVVPQLTDPRIIIPNNHVTASNGGNCCQSAFPEGYGSCRKDVDCTEDPKNPYCSAFGFCIPNDSGTNGCKACKVLRRCMSRKGC